MKQQSLSIEIPKPCHEKWSGMTPKAKGRHCTSCEKTVVDFTSMSKAGIVNYISTNDGQLCGRFRSDQLNVNLMPPKRNRFFSKWVAVFIGIIPIAGYGQVHPRVSIENQMSQQSKIGELSMVKKTNPISENGILSGRLLDAETGEPLLYATVVLLKNGVTIRGVETDMDGNFQLDISHGDLVSFSYIGYEEKVKTILEINELKSEFVLRLNLISNAIEMVEIFDYKVGSIIKGDFTTSGTACFGGVLARKESWLKRQWNKFKELVVVSHHEAVKNRAISRSHRFEERVIQELPHELINEVNGIEIEDVPFISVYPNPTSGLISIDMPKSFTKGILQIIDANNQLVFSRTLSDSRYQYDTSLLVNGTYIVSVISDNELIASEIFVKM